jgi:hypothetical protein
MPHIYGNDAEIYRLISLVIGQKFIYRDENEIDRTMIVNSVYTKVPIAYVCVDASNENFKLLLTHEEVTEYLGT